MTLEAIAADIAKDIGTEIERRGLKIVTVASKNPRIETHMIEFHDSLGRRLNLRLQVDTRASFWERCAVTVDRIERIELGSSGYVFEGVVGTRIHPLKTDENGNGTADLLRQLDRPGVKLCEVDSITNRTVTDYRFVEVIEKLESLADMHGGDAEILFKESQSGGNIKGAYLSTPSGKHVEVTLGDEFVDVKVWAEGADDYREWSAASIAQFSRNFESEMTNNLPTNALPANQAINALGI